ncbi:MAG: DUF6458 family protein [Actinomycetaceae bacterium]
MAALGIILIAVGAILSFAVQDAIAEVDLTMVGYILMGVGALAVIIGIVQIVSRRRTTHVTRVEDRAYPDEHPRDPRV